MKAPSNCTGALCATQCHFLWARRCICICNFSPKSFCWYALLYFEAMPFHWNLYTCDTYTCWVHLDKPSPVIYFTIICVSWWRSCQHILWMPRGLIVPWVLICYFHFSWSNSPSHQCIRIRSTYDDIIRYQHSGHLCINQVPWVVGALSGVNFNLSFRLD